MSRVSESLPLGPYRLPLPAAIVGNLSASQDLCAKVSDLDELDGDFFTALTFGTLLGKRGDGLEASSNTSQQGREESQF